MKVSPFSSLSKGGYSIRVYVGLDRGADSDHGTSNITLPATSSDMEDSVLLNRKAMYCLEIDSCHRDSVYRLWC